MTELPDNLPDDPKELKKLLLAIASERNDMHERLAILEHRYREEMRKKYGRSSEAFNPDQLHLFAQPGEPTPEAEEVQESTAKDAKKGGHGRRKPARELPRKPVIQDIEEHERLCSKCGWKREQCGRTISLQLDYVPGYAFYWEFIRLKYACRSCEGSVVVAPKPEQPIERGMPAPGMLSHIATNRFADHLPYYRQEGIFRRQGLVLNRSTMCGWMAETAGLLRPIYDYLIWRIKRSRVIWTDDTPLRVLDKKLKKRTRQGRLWVYRGDKDNPFIAFHYTPSRKRDGPLEFLKDYEGYMQADAFAGYDCVYVGGAVTEVACWAHARRKFFEAKQTSSACIEVLDLIQKLYVVEREWKLASADERVCERIRKSCPVLVEIKEKIATIILTKTPQSEVRKAAQYALNNWEALNVYTTDGDLTIDNNLAENAIRPIALGRKNWLFAGSDTGAETNAILSSLVASCKRQGIDPFKYLKTAIKALTEDPRHEPGLLVPGVLTLDSEQN